jgi:hypothetical protein
MQMVQKQENLNIIKSNSLFVLNQEYNNVLRFNISGHNYVT